MQKLFVGDVQGCAQELAELVARADDAFGAEWSLHLVGDVINRGPDNVRALALVRERCEAERGEMVLGNHEIGFLRAALGLARPRPSDTTGDLLALADRDEWIDWLRRRPLALAGQLGARPYAMVHAASHPAWDLGSLAVAARRVEAALRAPELDAVTDFLGRSSDAASGGRGSPAEDLQRLVSCRSAGPAADAWSAREPGADRRAWHAVWREAGHAHGIVYGHWAVQGLHVAPGLRGLDTGCVHHGRGGDRHLTGWLPDETRADPFALPDAGFWRVPAKRRYWNDAASVPPAPLESA